MIEFIFTLTHDDVTVGNALHACEQVPRDSAEVHRLQRHRCQPC
jgi:hypothetical protein